jgi:hypothetical protein
MLFRSQRCLSARSALQVEELEARLVPTLLGNQLFPSNNPWNQQITNAPVAAGSAAIMNNILTTYGNGQLHPDFGQDSQTPDAALYGIPYNVVHGNSTAKVHVVIDNYPGQNDLQDVPLPSGVVIEGDMQTGPTVGLANRGDSHLIVYDEDNNIAYEFYQASRPSENADGQWHAAQETVWNMNTNTFRTLDYTSADAAGLSILVGLVRPDEALPVAQGGQGVIKHAIRMTLKNAVILNQFLFPASHTANPGNTDAADMPPMGERFRLKAGVDISGLDPQSKIIAKAMKDYGLIVADNGSNFFFSGASYSVDGNNHFALTYDDNDIQDTVHGLKSLTYSDFEVPDLTPKVTGLSVSGGSAGSTITIFGQNFSGAAGRLQVLFGNSAASNVTVVDDGHVTAVVPAGSGTVDVRVQSGVNTPSDPNNIKTPIFGYGISASGTADRFTYGSTGRSIAGTVYDDLNDNGVLDPGEPGEAGVTVYLDTNNNGVLDSGEPHTLTDAQGNYTFGNLAAGTYTVREVLPTGATLTAPAAGSYTATPTGAVTGLNFENHSLLFTDINGTTLQIVGDDTAQALTLQLELGGAKLDVLSAGSVVVSFPVSAYTAIRVQLNGGNDSLTIADSNGNPAPAGGLTYDGGSGTNTLIGPNAGATWSITGTNSGTVSDGITFTNAGNLTGGSGNDSFVFHNGGSVTGNINGGGGSNTVNDFPVATAVVVNLGSLSAITTVFGGQSFSNTLVGANTTSTWNITGTNSGTVNGITFYGFMYLTGGSGNDTFKFGPNGSLGGNINGGTGTNTLDYSGYGKAVNVRPGSGLATALNLFSNISVLVGSSATTNTLVGANTANTWNITAANAGNVNAIAFSSFQNLTGGSGNDTFHFGPAGSVAGTINGGSGNNTLDYSALSTGVTVNLTTGTASFTGGVSNINGVLGGAGNDNLTGGSLPTFLVGGAGNDTLTAGSGRTILIGGAGSDTLTGGNSDDILIGGTTSDDASIAALDVLLAEWGSADTYANRVKYLSGTAGGLNGTTYLKTGTVFNDNASDTLIGGGGTDWFFSSTGDSLQKVQAGATVTSI